MGNLKLAAGRSARGHKIGLTSKAMQNSSNISEPDYGVLLDDMFFEDGSSISSSRFIVPRVEVELAFVLNQPLRGPGCTIFDVLRATEFVTPAVEIIDARIHQVDPETKVTRKVFDTISDNAANAGIMMGGRPFRPMDADMRSIAAVAYRNGVVEESGVAAAVLNHPATAWPSLRTSSRRMRSNCRPARSSWAAHSLAPSPRAPATRSTSTMAASAASPLFRLAQLWPIHGAGSLPRLVKTGLDRKLTHDAATGRGLPTDERIALRDCRKASSITWAGVRPACHVQCGRY